MLNKSLSASQVINNLERKKKKLEDKIVGLDDAAEYLADRGEKLERQVINLKDNNRVLLKQNEGLLFQTVASDLDLQHTRDTDTKFFDSGAEVLILKMNLPTLGPYYSRCCGMRFLPPILAHPTTTRSYSWWWRTQRMADSLNWFLGMAFMSHCFQKPLLQ